MAVGEANSIERRTAHDKPQSVPFSVATNGTFTPAPNTAPRCGGGGDGRTATSGRSLGGCDQVRCGVRFTLHRPAPRGRAFDGEGLREDDSKGRVCPRALRRRTRTDQRGLRERSRRKLQEYTAIVKRVGDWWIGWIEEVSGVNCQERSREELLETLTVTLGEALESNRQAARAAAGEGFTLEKVVVAT